MRGRGCHRPWLRSAGADRIGTRPDLRRYGPAGARGRGRRSGPDAVHHHVEDEILVRRMAGAGALVIGHKGGDIEGPFTALMELLQSIFPARDDHVLANHKFQRFISGAGHIGFEYFSGGEKPAGIVDQDLFARVNLRAIAGVLDYDINTTFGFGRMDTAVSEIFLDGVDFTVFFQVSFYLAVGEHFGLAGEDVEHFERDDDLIFPLEEG